MLRVTSPSGAVFRCAACRDAVCSTRSAAPVNRERGQCVTHLCTTTYRTHTHSRRTTREAHMALCCSLCAHIHILRILGAVIMHILLLCLGVELDCELRSQPQTYEICHRCARCCFFGGTSHRAPATNHTIGETQLSTHFERCAGVSDSVHACHGGERLSNVNKPVC